jgi:hypothetical protein
MGLIKLVENTKYAITDLETIPLQEAETKLIESHGQTFKPLRKFRVPISRFTENANNRIYPRELWERVIKEQREIWEGGLGLADHPTEDGSFKDVICVWSNLHIAENEDVVKADVTFVGELGEKAIAIMEAGGKVGFSSYGWGEFKEDGKTVRPDTYLLERVADVVLNPSQRVFGTLQHEVKETKIKENTNYNEGTNRMMNTQKISKLEQKRLYRDAMSFLENAKNMDNPQERLSEIQEIKESISKDMYPDLYQAYEEAEEAVKKEITEKLQHAVSLEKDFDTTNPEKFKEGLARLAVEAKSYAKEAQEWKTVALKMKETIANLEKELQSRPLPADIAKLKEELKKEHAWGIEMFNKKQELVEKYTKLLEHKEDEKTILIRHLDEAADAIERKNHTNYTLQKEYNKTIKKYRALKEKYSADITAYKKQLLREKVKEQLKEDFVDTNVLGTTSSFDGFNERKDIENYFNDKLRIYGKALLPYKEEILRCKTLQEASLKMLQIENNLEVKGDYSSGVINLRESTTNKDNSIGPYKLPKGWV